VLVTISQVLDETHVKVTGWPGNTPLTVADFPENPTVHRWEGLGPVTTGWIELEDGVEVQFAAGDYNVGDYWTIPARTLTANVIWNGNGGEPTFERRQGAQHHYAPLALLQRANDGSWTVKSDCRKLFPPLTQLRHCFMVGGTGQEKMPDPGGALVPLDDPLEVGVDNGSLPVQGATVRFTITAGNGTLIGNIQTTKIPTGSDGVARCAWSIDSVTELQQVEAVLVDDQDNPVDIPLHFIANLSRASDVRYNPGACPNLAQSLTVQSALDTLADLTTLVLESGDGQIVMPSETLDPIVVRAINACGAPITGGVVNFHVETGSGTLANGTNDENVPIQNGIASVQWTLGSSSRTQVVRATLQSATSGATALPIETPAQVVRFTANQSVARHVSYDPSNCPNLGNVTTVQAAIDVLCGLGGAVDKGIHITKVTLGGTILQNDASIKATDLANQKRPIRVFCDTSISPNSVVNKPTCYVTIDLPYPLVPQDIAFWTANQPIIGTQPLTLECEVKLASNDAKIIEWRPTAPVRTWLENNLMPAVHKRGQKRLLAHLTLLGNFIWSSDRRLYLDGEAFAAPSSSGTSKWTPPSGDGHRGGDFHLWFWIV
jgi:hypothetical protein